MITLIDSCCFINLRNSGLFPLIANNTGRDFRIQGLVEDELVQRMTDLDSLVSSGALSRESGAQILLSEVTAIAFGHNLGLGESECITICKKSLFCLATDDRRARTVGKTELGNNKVIGSIGLIREAVLAKGITSMEAVGACQIIRAKGGFIPQVGQDFFDR